MKKFLTLLFLTFTIALSQVNAQQADFIITSGLDGSVRKIDSSGNQLWAFTNHTNFVRHVAVDNQGFIYSASDDSSVRKIDSNGNQVWAFTNFSGIAFSVAVDFNQNVYFSSNDNNQIYKLDSNGNELWAVNKGHTSSQIALDTQGNLIAGLGNGDVIKLDSNGNTIWQKTFTPGNTIRGVAVDDQDNIYIGSYDDTLRKLDSLGNQVWSFTGHSNNVFGVAVDNNGFVYSASTDNTVRKIDSNGNQVWSFTGHTDEVIGIAVDLDGFVYSGSRDDTLRKIDSSGNQVWSNSSQTFQVFGVATSQPIPLTPQEPATYTVDLTTNTIYNDFIYTDDEVSIRVQDLSTTILNDEGFTITTNFPNTGSYTFNYWYDLDNMEIFTTNRTFTINDPNRDYNLIADYTLNDFITFNIDSNLPTPPDFELNTQTLELDGLTINQYPFNNYQHPTDRDWEIIAPTTNIGFYEFDYWYDNDNNEVYDLNPIITGSGFAPPNLTATYSLPEEYQINLTLSSNVGDITFQLGSQDPITGSFISVTIAENDSWTATAPNDTSEFGFVQWNDLDNNQIFSTNRSFGVSNTTRNYNLQAQYDPFYTIYWDSQGGTPISPYTLISGATINAPNDPVRPSFVFDGWEDINNNPITFPQIATQNITYQAVWLGTVTLTFDTNGGQRINSITTVENTTTSAVTPSRFGYEFQGWFTDEGTFQNAFDFNNPITQNTTIHAKWAFGSDRDAELSLTTFLDDNDLGDGFSQIVIMITIYIFVNIIILIYQAPLIVTLILNFIVTSLFMILGWIAIWIVVVIFMALFGLLYFFSSGRGITE